MGERIFNVETVIAVIELPSGKQKTIVKKVKMLLNISKIHVPEQIIGRYDKILKSKCRIRYDDMGDIILYHSFDEIVKLKRIPIVKGFMGGDI